ncbi:hypothetical protein TELCIR_15152 [Teladorsagia circumcincta]|uniref:Pleckstrin homology domain-containing protein n=1 Tax=Teladorsagia circumcincta TaxID=45464 RepID=A0A2G9TZA0_TELCI|nr:hypothetical protein TELCIR_15152 [Teladorsagia circumcincta]
MLACRNFQRVVRDQLPPSTQILEQPKPRPPTLTDFPSVRRNSVPNDSGGDQPSAASRVMESSMHSSYYKSAFSNPQLSKKTGSSDTFVIMSNVAFSGGTEVFGSFRSDGTMGAGDSQCPIEEEREAAREAARLFRLEGCTKADVAERLNDSKFEKPAKRSNSKRSCVSRQLLLEVDPESQVEYKCGYIMRKCVYDADGAKTPFGRRGWREWYARLRGLALYLGRDDSDKKRSRYEMFNNAILLHHAFAEPAPDYKKKQYIFRLRTADLGEFLFQTT